MKLAAEWDSYLRAVVPADAPEVQRVECRRAFYAGCQAMYMLVTGELPDDEDEAEAHLNELAEELRVFLREVQHLAAATCCAVHPDVPSVFCQRRTAHDGPHRNHEREWL